MPESNRITIVGIDLHSQKVQLSLTQWENGKEIKNNHFPKPFTTDLKSLEATYKKQIPKDSMSVIEATTNAFAVARLLRGNGFAAKVVVSDTVTGIERRDHINDKIDAHNLAKMEACNATREVFVPPEEFQMMRALAKQHEGAKQDMVRYSNRLWKCCSEANLKLPQRSSKVKIAYFEELLKESPLSSTNKFIIQDNLEAYKFAQKRKDEIEKRMSETVSTNESMLMVMQALGISYITAYVFMAYIVDIERFETPNKLVSYVGLNPVTCESGKSKSPHRITKYGIKLLKSLLVECAQAVLRRGGTPLAVWGRRLLASKKKPLNVVVCAVARKLLVYMWHILKGHVTPSEENKKSYTTKITKMASKLDLKALTSFKVKTKKELASTIVARIYELQLAKEILRNNPLPTNSEAYATE